jgi:hypothetical protein
MITRLINVLRTAWGLPIEQITGAVPVIPPDHVQVHAKNGFEVGYSAQLGPAGVMALAIQVPAGAYVHFQAAKLHFAGAIKFEVLEGPTFANGSAITPHNMHRIAPVKASVVTVKKAVDTIAGGTDLLNGPIFLGASGTPSRTSIGGFTGDTSERVLNPGTTYIFRVTSLEGSATINVAMIPFWYEESAA